MLFIIKGNSHDKECILRVHAADQREAEQVGWSRGVFVTEVIPLADRDPGVTTLDRVVDLMWRAWRHTPTRASKCFGRSVSSGQAAALIILGFATWAVELHNFGFVRF